MMRAGSLLSVVALLSSCGVVERFTPGAYGKPVNAAPVRFEGERFRASAKHITEDRFTFAVTVRRADRNIQAAFDAAQFEATTYCLGVFGQSNMAFPLEEGVTRETARALGNGQLALTGQCTPKP